MALLGARRRDFVGAPALVNSGQPHGRRLARLHRILMFVAMFCVSETEAAAIREAYEREGELSAAVELRRLFPGITDNAHARTCARMIAGWMPLPEPLAKATRPRPSRASKP